jgi:hypothetical protein
MEEKKKNKGKEFAIGIAIGVLIYILVTNVLIPLFSSQ